MVGLFYGFSNMKIPERIKNNPLSSLIIFVLLLWSIYPLALKLVFNKDWNSLGPFGDTYGALNTLFSGLAFAVLILSLFLQRKELEAQRIELEAQRFEIKESNLIAEAQRKITEQQAQLIEQQILDSKVQAFYQLLFNYLEKREMKLKDLRISPNGDVYGNRVLQRFCDRFEEKLKNTLSDRSKIEQENSEVLSDKIIEAIEYAHSSTRNCIKKNEYFEYIYFILNFIKMHENLKITANAVRTFIAYQSIEEMYCMFLFSTEDEFLYEYIEEFSLLSKINFYDENPIMTSLIHRMYDENAYS